MCCCKFHLFPVINPQKIDSHTTHRLGGIEQRADYLKKQQTTKTVSLQFTFQKIIETSRRSFSLCSKLLPYMGISQLQKVSFLLATPRSEQSAAFARHLESGLTNQRSGIWKYPLCLQLKIGKQTLVQELSVSWLIELRSQMLEMNSSVV